jgi:hypothetical protein
MESQEEGGKRAYLLRRLGGGARSGGGGKGFWARVVMGPSWTLSMVT